MNAIGMKNQTSTASGNLSKFRRMTIKDRIGSILQEKPSTKDGEINVHKLMETEMKNFVLIDNLVENNELSTLEV